MGRLLLLKLFSIHLVQNGVTLRILRISSTMDSQKLIKGSIIWGNNKTNWFQGSYN